MEPKDSEFKPIHTDLAQAVKDAVVQIGPKAKERGCAIEYSGPDYLITLLPNPQDVTKILTDVSLKIIEENEGPGWSIAFHLMYDRLQNIFIQVEHYGRKLIKPHIEDAFSYYNQVLANKNSSILFRSLSEDKICFTMSFPDFVILLGSRSLDPSSDRERLTVYLTEEDFQFEKAMWDQGFWIQTLQRKYGEENVIMKGHSEEPFSFRRESIPFLLQ